MFLSKYDESRLRQFCVSLEKYDRAIRKVTLVWWIHDYVDTLGKEQLVSYIRKMAESYPEIKEEWMLEKIESEYHH